MNWIFLVWEDLPFYVGVLGIILGALGFLRQRNLGFLLLALLFMHPIYRQITWWIYEHNFVQTQIAPGQWSAPVRNVYLEYPLAILILWFATLFFVRAAWRGRQKTPIAGAST